ncbi:MAG: hypothetical protein ABI866_04655, partial [Dokdonella sp.]
MNTRHSSPTFRRMPLVAAIVAVLTCLPVGSVLAQDNPTEQSNGETSNKLDTVVVTANKREEDVRKVASSISVIGDQQLENISATQLTDYANYVPG